MFGGNERGGPLQSDIEFWVGFGVQRSEQDCSDGVTSLLLDRELKPEKIRSVWILVVQMCCSVGKAAWPSVCFGFYCRFGTYCHCFLSLPLVDWPWRTGRPILAELLQVSPTVCCLEAVSVIRKLDLFSL